MTSAPQHGAAGQAAGYIFQAQWALLELLKRVSSAPNDLMRLEQLDDIEFESAGQNVELLQVKHSLHAVADLTDGSRNLWSTLAVWMDHLRQSPQTELPRLTLVTTGIAPPGSAAALLRPEHRDVDRALGILESAATSLQSNETKAAREQFIGLPPESRYRLVAAITMVDGVVRVDEFAKRLREELVHALPGGLEVPFVERVLGWWWSSAVRLLTGDLVGITPGEVQMFIDDLRDQFGPENLPTDVDIETFDEAAIRGYSDRRFVKQLHLIAFSSGQLRLAIHAYHLAFTQRSRWLREELVGLHELEDFEKRLRFEWRYAFEDMIAALPRDASPQDKEEAGRALLNQLIDGSRVRIRDRYEESFMTRGSLHGLADDPKQDVGWHPEFREHLGRMLLGEAAG